MQETTQSLDLGIRIGRGQAFGLIAAHSLLAQAESLREIRDAQSYKLLDLTWDDFCSQYAGLSRPRVDALIHSLEEFGAAYFQLSEIIKVSPETYRQIAPQIQGESIEIEGQLVPIAPENAARIRAEIQRLRAGSAPPARASKPDVPALQSRFDRACADVRRLTTPETAAALYAFSTYAIDRLTKIRAELAAKLL